MNTLLLESASIKNGQSVVTGRQHMHLQKVLNVKIGSSFRVGEVDGKLGTAIVQTIQDTSTTVELHLHQEPPLPIPITLILALPRPKMLRRILQTIAAMGVKSLYIINAQKVEKSYWQSAALSPEAARTHFLLGLEQACDTRLPMVRFFQQFKPFVEDNASAITSPIHNYVAEPRAKHSCPIDLNSPSTIAIGPERGFTSYELEKFLENGFRAVHMGPRILRVENAVSALISRLYPS